MDISLLATVLSVIVALSAIYLSQRNFKKTIERAAQQEAIEISTRMAILETKVDVVWKGVAFDLAQVLHQPHAAYAERDSLLEKLLAEDIKSSELLRLRDILKDTIGGTEDEGNYGEKVAASLLMRIIESTLISSPDTSLLGQG